MPTAQSTRSNEKGASIFRYKTGKIPPNTGVVFAVFLRSGLLLGFGGDIITLNG
jgi:hypothetical protein